MDLILIRHPAVAVATGICYGASDVPLAAAPHIEIARLADRLTTLCEGRSVQFHASTLSRCTAIATPLARHFEAVLQTDARLRELDFGRWEMQAWDAIPRAELDTWADDVEHACTHGGESVSALAGRVQSWLTELETHSHPPETEAGACAVVLTHAGVMRVLAALALRLPLAASLDWQLELGAICHLRRRWRGDGWTLVSWNY